MHTLQLQALSGCSECYFGEHVWVKSVFVQNELPNQLILVLFNYSGRHV